MMLQRYPLLLAMIAASSYAALTSTGNYFIPRSNVCRNVTATASTSTIAVKSNCLTFNWADYKLYTETYTTYRDEATSKSYKAFLATFPVFGSFDSSFNPNLTY